MRRRTRFSFGLLFLWLILVLPYLAQAQAQAPAALSSQKAAQVGSTVKPPAPQAPDAAADADSDPDDDAPGPAIFVLDVSFQLSGSLRVTSSAFNAKDVQPLELKTAVENSLGCDLLDTDHAKPLPTAYFGTCTPSVSAGHLLRQGKISTLPLQAFCHAHGVERLSVGFHFPQTDVAESIPPAPSYDTRLVGVAATTYRKFLRFSPVYTWPVTGAIPAQIQYRFGFEESQLKRGAIFLALALFLPLVLCFWLGRKALSAQTPDKAVVWFSYMRYLNWTLTASLLGWWVALDESHLREILNLLVASTRYAALWKHPATYELVSWFPPAIIWLLCLHLSHPVQEKLRGLQWTRGELSLQSLYSILMGLVPLALFLTGLRVMGTGAFRTGMYWFVAAFLVRLFAARGLLKLTGMQPHALTTGDLRDRAFAFAEKLGVKLRGVFLIPSGKGQMANAFARTGNTISFTDFLLQRMSAREVDYVMAHELTHLKLKHPAKLGYAYIGGYFLGSTLVAFVPHLLVSHLLFRYAFVFAGITVFPYFFSRRFEYAADAGAVALTEDPRAAISALFKLSELNMMPTQWSHWSEKWVTHPSTLRRAQAIAKKAGIPFEEIPAIVREGQAAAPTYSAKSTSAPADKIHSSLYKRGLRTKLSWSLIATLTLIPCLFGLFATHLQSFHLLQIIVLVAGVPATFAGFLVLSNYVPSLTHGNLIPALNKKFAAQGVRLDEWSGIHVGFAPSAAPRTYETTFNWDLGYLFFRSDRLCYWGEEIQFALRREQITAIKVAAASPGFIPVKRIYIAWQDSSTSACGVLNISCRVATTIYESNAKTVELARRLQTWWQTPAPVRPLPQLLADLQSPKTVNVTCGVPGSKLVGAKLLKELFLTGLLSAIAAVLFGLPFHLFAYLNPAINKSLGIASPFHSPGAGWYAVAVTVFIRWFILIPSMRYKDKPVLIAQSPANLPADLSTQPSRDTAPVA